MSQCRESIVFTPGSSGATVSQIELSISCRGLHDVDTFSLSNPMVVVEEKIPGTSKWQELGRTEVIFQNLNTDLILIRRAI